MLLVWKNRMDEARRPSLSPSSNSNGGCVRMTIVSQVSSPPTPRPSGCLSSSSLFSGVSPSPLVVDGEDSSCTTRSSDKVPRSILSMVTRLPMEEDEEEDEDEDEEEDEEEEEEDQHSQDTLLKTPPPTITKDLYTEASRRPSTSSQSTQPVTSSDSDSSHHTQEAAEVDDDDDDDDDDDVLDNDHQEFVVVVGASRADGLTGVLEAADVVVRRQQEEAPQQQDLQIPTPESSVKEDLEKTNNQYNDNNRNGNDLYNDYVDDVIDVVYDDSVVDVEECNDHDDPSEDDDDDDEDGVTDFPIKYVEFANVEIDVEDFMANAGADSGLAKMSGMQDQRERFRLAL